MHATFKFVIHVASQGQGIRAVHFGDAQNYIPLHTFPWLQLRARLLLTRCALVFRARALSVCSVSAGWTAPL